MINKKDEKDYKYDFSIKTKDERAEYIEDKIGYILDLPPHTLMGYSSKSREGDKKYNRIPRMIDRYTSYYLDSKDIGSSKNTEYRYYLDEHDDRKRKNNQILFHKSSSFDGGKDGKGVPLVDYSEIYEDEDKSFIGSKDYSFESNESSILIYALRKGELSKKEYKKVLYMSSDILIKTRDEELKEEVEQVVFNCLINCSDSADRDILREYISGATLREVSEKVGLSKSTVDRRITKMLDWVGQK